MKNIKKTLFTLLILLGGFTLVACKKDEPIVDEPIIEEPIETPEEPEEPETPEEPEEESNINISLEGMFQEKFEPIEVDIPVNEHTSIMISDLYTTSSANKYLMITHIEIDDELFNFDDSLLSPTTKYESEKMFGIFKGTNIKIEFDRFSGLNVIKLRVNKEDTKQNSGVLEINTSGLSRVKLVLKYNDNGKSLMGQITSSK